MKIRFSDDWRSTSTSTSTSTNQLHIIIPVATSLGVLFLMVAMICGLVFYIRKQSAPARPEPSDNVIEESPSEYNYIDTPYESCPGRTPESERRLLPPPVPERPIPSPELPPLPTGRRPILPIQALLDAEPLLKQHQSSEVIPHIVIEPSALSVHFVTPSAVQPKPATSGPMPMKPCSINTKSKQGDVPVVGNNGKGDEDNDSNDDYEKPVDMVSPGNPPVPGTSGYMPLDPATREILPKTPHKSPQPLQKITEDKEVVVPGENPLSPGASGYMPLDPATLETPSKPIPDYLVIIGDDDSSEGQPVCKPESIKPAPAKPILFTAGKIKPGASGQVSKPGYIESMTVKTDTPKLDKPEPQPLSRPPPPLPSQHLPIKKEYTPSKGCEKKQEDISRNPLAAASPKSGVSDNILVKTQPFIPSKIEPSSSTDDDGYEKPISQGHPTKKFNVESSPHSEIKMEPSSSTDDDGYEKPISQGYPTTKSNIESSPHSEVKMEPSSSTDDDGYEKPISPGFPVKKSNVESSPHLEVKMKPPSSTDHSEVSMFKESNSKGNLKDGQPDTSDSVYYTIKDSDSDEGYEKPICRT